MGEAVTKDHGLSWYISSHRHLAWSQRDKTRKAKSGHAPLQDAYHDCMNSLEDGQAAVLDVVVAHTARPSFLAVLESAHGEFFVFA